MRPDGPRDPVAGPRSGPEPPFPIKLSGPVIKGFGRGSKEHLGSEKYPVHDGLIHIKSRPKLLPELLYSSGPSPAPAGPGRSWLLGSTHGFPPTGSLLLGIPTANIPPGPLDQYPDLSTGVYYGLVGLLLPSPPPETSSTTLSSPPPPSTAESSPSTYPAVLSIGYNPFYANKTRSIEIHILQDHIPSNSPSSSSSSSSSLPSDFYGAPLNLLILGFIRPEYDYVSKESLIEDIRMDCGVASRSLEREAYRRYEEGEWGKWLRDFRWVEKDGKEEGETWGERVQEAEREVGVK